MEIKDAFQFCPRCGARFLKEAAKLQCESCGLSYYLNPKPVQSLVLQKPSGEYLFVVRGVEPAKGSLDFPGGFVEEGETFEETTRRELKEELGIEVGELEYLSSHTDDYLFQDINHKVSGVTYVAKLPEGAKLKPADDVESVEFYKLEDVPKDRIAFPSMHEILAKLAEREA